MQDSPLHYFDTKKIIKKSINIWYVSQTNNKFVLAKKLKHIHGIPYTKVDYPLNHTCAHGMHVYFIIYEYEQAPTNHLSNGKLRKQEKYANLILFIAKSIFISHMFTLSPSIQLMYAEVYRRNRWIVWWLVRLPFDCSTILCLYLLLFYLNCFLFFDRFRCYHLIQTINRKKTLANKHNKKYFFFHFWLIPWKSARNMI